MAFKIPEKCAVCPDDPESLFRDLRKKSVPGLLSHQADLLRSYLAVHTKHSDIAFNCPPAAAKLSSVSSSPSGGGASTGSA